MTRNLRVHFDGKVLVPDEAVDLPIGEPLHVEVHQSNDVQSAGAKADLVAWLESLPALAEPLPQDMAAQHDHYLYGTAKHT